MPSQPGFSWTIRFIIMASSKPGRCHGSHTSEWLKFAVELVHPGFAVALAASAIPQSGCR